MQGSFSISITWGVAWTEQGEIPKNAFLRFFKTAFISSTATLEVNEPHTPKFFGPLTLNCIPLPQGNKPKISCTAQNNLL